MTLRLEQLRYFVASAEEGQLTRAARKLHLAQPALSQAISQLESELGIELLRRHARGVTLTPAGEAFLTKARVALEAASDAIHAAQSMARAQDGTLEIGFVGPPPTLNAPELFAVFADVHSDAEIAFRGLPFPSGPTAAWLETVDVAFCHPPAPAAGIRIQTVRAEPRVLLVPHGHPLAQRGEMAVEEVLGESFISYHPDVQPQWAAFHSLDDHRGGPPPRMTKDHVRTPTDMLAIMASPRAVTALPACDAAIIVRALPMVAIPLSDARPAPLSLVWREDNRNPLLDALVGLARSLADASSADGRAGAA